MPVELAHLGGQKAPRTNGSKPADLFPAGTRVRLKKTFKTGDQKEYPEGSRGISRGKHTKHLVKVLMDTVLPKDTAPREIHVLHEQIETA